MAAIWKDVEETRAAADAKVGQVRALFTQHRPDAISDEAMAEAVVDVIDAFRFEIRAAAQTISHALTVHAEELREMNRGR